MKRTLCSFFAVAALATGLRAEEYRTDINPALLSYLAFMTAQNVPQADYDYLTTNDWRGQSLPPKVGTLLGNYNAEFKLLRQAAHARVPADWGIDLTAGPETLLPHLARGKGAAQIGRLRMIWELQNGRPAAGRDDVLAVFALARNLAHDGVLISALVQVAMENIALNCLAENYYQFGPETLQQLADGFDAAPPRGTMADAIAVAEKESFYGWFVRRVKTVQQQHSGDEPAAIAGIRQLLLSTMSGGDGEPTSPSALVDKILQTAGGTSDGVLQLLAPLPPLYDRAAAIARLPARDFEAQAVAFHAEVQASPNPFVGEFFPALENCRRKELGAIVKLAMFRAAVEYRLHGEVGLAGVVDPGGKGPFSFQRFTLNGVDRGFRLSSAYTGRGYPETLIFVEHSGTPFLVDGPHAGDPVGKPASAPH